MLYPVYTFPPDPYDDFEWGLTHRLASILPRVATLEDFIGFLLVAGVLLSIILFKLFLLALRRLWDVYQARATATTRSGQALKYAGIGLLVLWALALLLAIGGLQGIAFLVFAVSLFLYTFLSELVDYQASKADGPPPVLPDNIAIEDLITWKDEVDAAAVGVSAGA